MSRADFISTTSTVVASSGTPAAPQGDAQEISASAAQARTHARTASELARLQQFDAAIEEYAKGVHLAPNDAAILEDYGELLIHVGRLEEALGIFRRSYALKPDGYDSGLALSSLLHKHKDYVAARQILEEVVTRHPIALNRGLKQQRPTILRARGFANCNYEILRGRDGQYTYLLRGGHFSIKHLLKKSEINLLILNVFGQNTDSLAEAPEVDLLLNTISCPDLERTSLLSLARFIDRNPQMPVINHPRRVLDTTRDRNCQRLNAIPGVIFPHTERLHWDGASVDAILDEVRGLGFELPIILRAAGSQTGSGVVLAHDIEKARHYFEQAVINKDHYVIQYLDCQRPNGLYHKARIFCIDGQYYPVACLHRDAWNIHSGDRYDIMAEKPWTQDEEKAYLGDPVGYLGSETYNKLLHLRDIVGLEFFGIDFTILDDGSLFIFELNPAMRHNFDHVKTFPYTEPYLIRISGAFAAMIQKRLHAGDAGS